MQPELCSTRMNTGLPWRHARALVQHALRILPSLAYCTSCISLVYTYPLGYQEVH